MTTTHSAGPAAGERLKQARESAGLSLAAASARTRLPTRVLEALESGEWERLGPPVFVRGQARSYARVLGICLDSEALPSPFTTTQIPSLVSHVHIPRYKHVAESLGRRAVYVVMTAALVVPVWLATRNQGDGAAVASLDLAPAQASALAIPERTPLVASIAPMGASTAPAAAAMELEFTADSWVQIFGKDGAVIESGMRRAGERRTIAAAEVARLVLGNAATVQLHVDGRQADLSPYIRANVARFTLSSDGSLAPSAP